MARVGRYVKFRARPGQGDALAEALLQAAAGAASADGCELYVINRSPDEPGTVWVTEVWRSQADVDAALAHPATRAQIAEVLPLVDGPPERIDVTPIGGVGIAPAD